MWEGKRRKNEKERERDRERGGKEERGMEREDLCATNLNWTERDSELFLPSLVEKR